MIWLGPRRVGRWLAVAGLAVLTVYEYRSAVQLSFYHPDIPTEMAEGARDKPTADRARARLAAPDVASEEATQQSMMNAGLDALYRRGDPAAAAAQFRKVLDRNAGHYGATFQLATALDRAGKPVEARPEWERVLKMAEGFNDAQTAATARARLSERP